MAAPKATSKKLRTFEIERRDSIDKETKIRRNSLESTSQRRLSDSFGKNDADVLMFDKLKDVLTEVHQEIQRRNTLSDIDQVRVKQVPPPSVDASLMSSEWEHNTRPEAWKFK